MSKTLCPSFTADAGALLLGRVTEGRRVARLRTPLPITHAFLEALPEDGATAEHHFRFAGPCHQSACTRWANQACQLIEQLCDAPAVAVGDSLPATTPLAECGIRVSCRWFRQRREQACSICPMITRQSAETAG